VTSGPPNSRRSEILKRLLADTCEMCGSHDGIEVHHIRHLRDLTAKGRADRPAWVQQMAARHRKTLVVCFTDTNASTTTEAETRQEQRTTRHRRAGCSQRCMPGSVGGRRKRTCPTGTTLTAYPTSRTDLWGAAGEIPAAYPAPSRSEGYGRVTRLEDIARLVQDLGAGAFARSWCPSRSSTAA